MAVQEWTQSQMDTLTEYVTDTFPTTAELTTEYLTELLAKAVHASAQLMDGGYTAEQTAGTRSISTLGTMLCLLVEVLYRRRGDVAPLSN